MDLPQLKRVALPIITPAHAPLLGQLHPVIGGSDEGLAPLYQFRELLKASQLQGSMWG